MRLYLDCKFTGSHRKTTLISMAIVDEKGKSFYAELVDYDDSQLNSWIIDNIISKLVLTTVDENFHSVVNNVTYCKGTVKEIAKYLDEWLSCYNNDMLEIWSDCMSYDWLLFVDLYGSAFDIPTNISIIPFDLCTLFKAYNIDPEINRENFIKSEGILFNSNNKHNALHDALIAKTCHDKLIKMYNEKK